MYDGFRHFLFIVPPLFVLAGIALEVAFEWLKHSWLKIALVIILLFPGLWADVYLHPYQYTYYNQFVGGTGKAAYSYETDFWLTCYKDAVQELLPYLNEPTTNLYVNRESYIADYYAPQEINVIDARKRGNQIAEGDYILMHSRANPSLQRFRDPSQAVLRVERDGAIFCVTQKR